MRKRVIRMYLVNSRQKLGLSQNQVAKRMGVCHQHYNRIENGIIGRAIQFKTIYSLSTALNISIEIMSDEETKYQNSLIKREEP